MDKKSRVAIIGAGVSGLAAAVRLAAHPNIDLTIFEARREPGGRTRSFVDSVTGDTLDNGQHILASCYTSTLEYLRTIGSESLLRVQASLDIEYWERGTKSRLRLPGIPSPVDLALGLLRTDLLSRSEQLAALRFGRAVQRRALPADTPTLTVRQLLDAYQQPASVIAKLWEPLVLATINASLHEASAEVFVNVLRDLFFGREKGSRLLFPKVGLTALLIDPAVKMLKPSTRLRLGEVVRKVEAREEEALVQTDHAAETFDYVIRTDSFTGTASSPIVNAYFWLDREILSAPIAGFLGTTLQWVFPKPSIYAKQFLALTVSAAQEIVDHDIESIKVRLWSDLQMSVPESRVARLLHYQIIKEKRATPLITPEAHQARPSTHTGTPRVFLAGDYVQNGLPATIEGAVRNGFAAAESVLREAGSLVVTHNARQAKLPQ